MAKRPICSPWNCPKLVSAVGPAHFFKSNKSKKYTITMDKKMFWDVDITAGVKQTFKEFKKRGAVPDYGLLILQGTGKIMSDAKVIAFIPCNDPKDVIKRISLQQMLRVHNKGFEGALKSSARNIYQAVCTD